MASTRPDTSTSISMSSCDIKGNNPFLLNRMNVDRDIKRSMGMPNADRIQGYNADGNIILRPIPTNAPQQLYAQPQQRQQQQQRQPHMQAQQQQLMQQLQQQKRALMLQQQQYQMQLQSMQKMQQNQSWESAFTEPQMDNGLWFKRSTAAASAASGAGAGTGSSAATTGLGLYAYESESASTLNEAFMPPIIPVQQQQQVSQLVQPVFYQPQTRQPAPQVQARLQSHTQMMHPTYQYQPYR